MSSKVSLMSWREGASLAFSVTIMGYTDVLFHQPALHPIFSLVKTDSDFIVRSVETGVGRWMLVVAVISVNAYPFLAFSDLTRYLEDIWIGVFWLHRAAC